MSIVQDASPSQAVSQPPVGKKANIKENDDLLAEGLVTQEEYEKMRLEILFDRK